MCPCGVETAEDGGGDDRGDGPGEDGVRKELEQEVRDRVGDEAVNSKDVKTTEAREEAGAGAKVFDGCAELGSYGFGLDDEDLLLDQRSGLFLRGERSVRVVLELSSWGCVDDDCGSWAFDHSEGGYHLTKSVADLKVVSQSPPAFRGTFAMILTAPATMKKKTVVSPSITSPHVGNWNTKVC